MGLEVILVGLDRLIPDIGYEPDIVGDDAAELTVEPGIDSGTDIGSRGIPDTARPLIIGETRDGWVSRR
jgi:hypothetical protein